MFQEMIEKKFDIRTCIDCSGTRHTLSNLRRELCLICGSETLRTPGSHYAPV